jgi:UTP--glucose-1-phosphate uridylyltransferase
MSNFAPFAAKMMAEALPQIVIDNFRHYYEQLAQGATGFIDRTQALPVTDLPDAERFGAEEETAGRQALSQTVVLKLNGGLGTSMGLQAPKSLLVVKDGLSFLDITVKQMLHQRAVAGVRLPLVLMNSFNTREESLAALRHHPELEQSLPFDFLQHKIPKIMTETLAPAEWPDDPEKEWCPPGHGDIYPALITSGMLAALLAQGYRYLFVSNADNLGATLDLRILGHFVNSGAPFLMEVADRTAADRKGGHLARRPDGGLLLRESAQCPPEEESEFQDIERFIYFNTNNLWIDLPALDRLLQETGGVLGLPLIRNEKPVDPAHPDSYRVYQLETAMGSAIARFAGAQGLRVPRTRFVPVKKNSDLLVLLSDAYELQPDFTLALAPTCGGAAPLVELDGKFFGMLPDFEQRFPAGPPSLKDARTLTVHGDVTFGAHVTVRGTVHVDGGDAPSVLADDTILAG